MLNDLILPSRVAANTISGLRSDGSSMHIIELLVIFFATYNEIP